MPFEPGQSGNPAGRPNHGVMAYQGFVERAKYLCGQHTVGDIIDIACDEKRLRKLSTFDGLIIKRLAEGLKDDGNQSMNSILDRIIGKPVQPVAQKVEHSIDGDTLAAMKEIAQLSRDDMAQIKSILDMKVVEHVPGDD